MEEREGSGTKGPKGNNPSIKVWKGTTRSWGTIGGCYASNDYSTRIKALKFQVQDMKRANKEHKKVIKDVYINKALCSSCLLIKTQMILSRVKLNQGLSTNFKVFLYSILQFLLLRAPTMSPKLSLESVGLHSSLYVLAAFIFWDDKPQISLAHSWLLMLGLSVHLFFIFLGEPQIILVLFWLTMLGLHVRQTFSLFYAFIVLKKQNTQKRV